MTITVASLGSTLALSATSATLTTTADSPAGTMVAVFTWYVPGGGVGVTSVTDSAGNTWIGNTPCQAVGTERQQTWTSVLTHDLPLGGTITVDVSASGSSIFLCGAVMTSVSTLDTTTANSAVLAGSGRGLTNTPTVTGMTLSYPVEIVFNICTVEAGYFNSFPSNALVAVGSGDYGTMVVAYQIVSNTSPVSFYSNVGGPAPFFTGYTESYYLPIEPATAALTLTGYPPALASVQMVNPAAPSGTGSALKLTGYAPTLNPPAVSTKPKSAIRWV